MRTFYLSFVLNKIEKKMQKKNFNKIDKKNAKRSVFYQSKSVFFGKKDRPTNDLF